MPEIDTRLQEYLPTLHDLAEGRVEPDHWLDWWREHEPGLKGALKPGWFLELKPRTGGSSGPNRPVFGSQSGARRILDALEVAYQWSDRYERGAQAELEAYIRAQKKVERARAKKMQPFLERLQPHFPKFARFLKRNAEQIDRIEPGYTEEEIAAFEERLRLTLPQSYRQWLGAVGELSLEGLRFGSEHPFIHENTRGVELPSAGMLAFADYFLQADGDQVLFDLREGTEDDPPVFYYSHSVPEVRREAKSFTAWIESLPRSPVLSE